MQVVFTELHCLFPLIFLCFLFSHFLTPQKWSISLPCSFSVPPTYVDRFYCCTFLLVTDLQVLCHETCHLFYMSHCVFFDCLMNQSRSVAEAMSQPLYLCPVCMRKLQKVLRFPSVVQYMRNVLQFLCQLIDAGLANRQLNNTVLWLEHCLTIIETD